MSMSAEIKYLTLEIYTSRSMFSTMDWSRDNFHFTKVDNSLFKCNLGFQFSACILLYPCTSSENKDFSGHCKWAQYPCSLTVTNSLKGRGDLSLPEELKNPVILSCHLPPIPLLLTRDLGSFANVTPPCRSFAAAAIAGNHLSFPVEQTELHLMTLVSSLQPSVPISFLFLPLFTPHSLF